MAKTLTAGKAAGARTKQDKRAYAQLGHNTWRKASCSITGCTF